MSNRTCSVEGCARKYCAKGWCKMHYYRMRNKGNLESRADLTDHERFLTKISKSPGCWEWIAGKVPDGYGSFYYDGGDKKAHRYSYEYHVGPIPEGMQIDHACGNRGCVNPEHLRLATPKQNAEHLTVLRVNNKSGYRGVCYHEGKKRWIATVGHRGKSLHLGGFSTAEEAGRVAKAAREALYAFPEFAPQDAA